jgi:hypothetical protein
VAERVQLPKSIRRRDHLDALLEGDFAMTQREDLVEQERTWAAVYPWLNLRRQLETLAVAVYADKQVHRSTVVAVGEALHVTKAACSALPIAWPSDLDTWPGGSGAREVGDDFVAWFERCAGSPDVPSERLAGALDGYADVLRAFGRKVAAMRPRV